MSIAASVLIVLSAGGLLLYNNYHSENPPKQAMIIKSPAKPIAPEPAAVVTADKVTNNTLQPSLSKAKSQEQFTANKMPIVPHLKGAADNPAASMNKETSVKDTTPLDEVVVVGYTAQKKKDVTASVSIVNP